MLKGNLLVVDDDVKVLESLELFLDLEFKEVHFISNPNLIPDFLGKNKVQVVLLDMNFNAGRNTGNEGLYWLKQIKSINKNIEIVLFTAFGDVELAVNCIKEGAFDFILKPWDNKKLLSTLNAALKMNETNAKVLKLENLEKQLSDDLSRPFTNIIGSSQKMKHVFSLIEKVSKTDASVLILGENGTGKELVARDIHVHSERKDKPFIRVDLGSLSENVFESELFGHVKGAFTDAKEDRAGRFETASGGTLFLDEIGNIPLSLQQKLLTAIEAKVITPVGSNIPISVDIHLICATNVDLNEKVRLKEFREDLLYRINTIQIKIPELRDRGSDILEMANFFLKKNSKKYNKTEISFREDALIALRKHSWPGNVRELEHTIERAVILCQSSVLTSIDLGLSNINNSKVETLRKSLEEIEKGAIQDALNHNQGNVSEAAKELRITRQTIYNKISKYRIEL